VTANKELAPPLFISEAQATKAARPSKTIRANKGKAKLRAKHRRPRASATG